MPKEIARAPLPIDRVAARVVRKAAPDDVWETTPSIEDTRAHSQNALEACSPPAAIQRDVIAKLIGAKRGRLTVIGYAKDQNPNPKASARWVVRCDCGAYEHRTRILRWLEFPGDDMCRSCMDRRYRTLGKWTK